MLTRTSNSHYHCKKKYLVETEKHQNLSLSLSVDNYSLRVSSACQSFPFLLGLPNLLLQLTYNINVHKPTTGVGTSKGRRRTSADGLFSELKKKRLGSGEYLLEVIKEIQEIEAHWQTMVVALEDELAKARKLNIPVDDDEAYLRCAALLQEEFEAEETALSKDRRKLRIALQTAEEHLQVCEGEKAEREKERSILQEQLKDQQVEIAKANKRARRSEQLHNQIEEAGKAIETANLKLQELKERSYQQKALYLEAQEAEMRLLEEAARVEQEEQSYHEFQARQEKYRQLTKILEKLHSRSAYSNRDVEAYLKDRIADMAALRTNLLSLDDRLQQLETMIEEQNFIVEGLRTKSDTLEGAQGGSAFRKYQSKYEELYFDRSSNLQSWKSYKSYLQELLKRNKVRHHLTDSPRPHLKSSHVVRPHRTEPAEEEPSLSPSFKAVRSPLQKKMSQMVGNSGRESVPLRLPKLGKGVKGKEDLKSNIKRMMNQSDISLESVDSNEDNISGEFIEVEFHKR